MSKYQACIVSAVQTGTCTYTVSTAQCFFYGVSAYGSAAASTISVCNSVTAAGYATGRVFAVTVGITAGTSAFLSVPLVCGNGIAITAGGGTAAGVVVFYSVI